MREEAVAGRFPAYRAYRDSGVEWLGKVPVEWETRRLKWAAAINMGQSPPSDECNDRGVGRPFLQGNAEFGTVSPEPRLWCDTAPKHAGFNDILLSVRAPIGALNRADQEYGIGRGLCAVRVKDGVYRDFVFRALGVAAPTVLEAEGTGSTFKAVGSKQVADLPVPLPPLPEQRAIATFLDRETAKIDTLVLKKERLLELLDEQRTALISRAVTRGLDPDVPMRDSGVEWLGEVPEGWKVTQLRYQVRDSLAYGVLKPDKYDGGDGVPLIRILDIEAGEILREQLQAISPEQSREYRRTVLDAEDVVVSVVGTLGRCFVVPSDLRGANLSRALARIQPGHRLVPHYLAWVLESLSFGDFVERVAWGTAQRVLNIGALANFAFPLPPLPEQHAIAAYLDRETARIDALKTKIQRAIDLLKEYRTALISAAVTGKIDVRGEVTDSTALP